MSLLEYMVMNRAQAALRSVPWFVLWYEQPQLWRG